VIEVMAALVLASSLEPQPRVRVEVPEIEIPEIDIEIPELPALLAEADEDHGDKDADNDDEEEHDEKGVHVYKMKPQHFHFPRIHVGGDEDSFDEGEATAKVKGRGSATLPVKGAVTFQLQAQGGDVEVATAPGSQVRVSLEKDADEEVSLYASGDRVRASIRGRRMFRHGKMRVELPVGSRLELTEMSGDVTAQHLAEARVRSMSGDVKLVGVDKADVTTISGDVRIDDARGQVRLHTVSGHAVIASAGGAPQVEFRSTSGDMDWSGACGKDCHLSAETMSGEVRLALDPKSSFELSYTSHSGELRDGINLTVKRSPKSRRGFSSGSLDGTFGKGEGVIEADAFSGNLILKKK